MTKTIDLHRLILDMLFFGLSFYCFYNQILLSFFSLILLVALALRKRAYVKSLHTHYFNGFIDFLNHLDAHLSVGLNFKRAVLMCSESGANDVRAFGKIIQMNGTDQDLFEAIQNAFPIAETSQFVILVRQAVLTGVSISKIVSITLERMHLKYKLEKEVELILFQKRLEQGILCIAPLFIILLVRNMSPNYLSGMYGDWPGRVVMTIAFGFLILMKALSEKIVKIDF